LREHVEIVWQKIAALPEFNIRTITHFAIPDGRSRSEVAAAA